MMLLQLDYPINSFPADIRGLGSICANLTCALGKIMSYEIRL